VGQSKKNRVGRRKKKRPTKLRARRRGNQKERHSSSRDTVMRSLSNYLVIPPEQRHVTGKFQLQTK
jgi:hypothetical protein